MSPCFSAAASNTGANARHGGHHCAQKSMKRMPPFFTAPSKFVSVSSTVVAPMSHRITCRMASVLADARFALHPVRALHALGTAEAALVIIDHHAAVAV